ncbi:MAG: methyltransferase domain-containing protein [Bdellovibrionaceae bacterium]|nr:methyltransferase domain-containing protein [Pseudobdellovibrionaceae bacterium]
MKYHKHLFDKTASTLVHIFTEDAHADKVIEKLFKENKKWGKRDRQFVAETVYDCVRWKALYDFILTHAHDSALTMIDVHLLWKNEPLPDWSKTKLTRADMDSLLKSAPAHILASFPEWLYERAQQEIGADRWKLCAQALNEQAHVVLRSNSLKKTRKEVAAALAQEGFETEIVEHLPEALILKKRGNIFRSVAFQSGFFEVQDANSQHVALMVNPQPGERIIDACAGAGGKSLHLAALMKNKGKLLSLDIYDSKLEELRRRSRRAGVDIIETRPIESTKVIKRLQDSADAVLLDVPCSGLGVLKRNPDSKWKLSPEKISTLQKTQNEILSSYSRMVKPKGRLIYSTCSILPSENQDQVEHFLKENPNWKKVSDQTLWPHITGFDGFYLCHLERTS